MIFLYTTLLFACRTSKPASTSEGLVDTADTELTDLDGDGYQSDEDCDDGNASVHPNATEICDGMDNNCDGQVDEGVLLIFFTDQDEDGFGDDSLPIESCQQQNGTVPNNNDCDDTDATVFPSAEELCDGIDNNCNAVVDENVTFTQYMDQDGDGFGNVNTGVPTCTLETGFVLDNEDCDDDNASVHPNASEVCDDIDNNCDGLIDDASAVDRAYYYKDADNDGFGDPAEGEAFCTPPQDYIDNNLDCDDIDSTIHPNAVEVCDDQDNDCDGDIDALDSDIQGATLYYIDNDNDGFGDDANSTLLCDPTSGWSLNNLDCNDSEALAHTNAVEVCDGIDNDCNGDIDDDDANIDPTSQSLFYIDADTDGFGDVNQPIQQCTQGPYSINDDDCDDNNPQLNPNTTWYVDQDNDGFGNPNATLQICTQPIGYIDNNQDCDDQDVNIHPNTEWYTDGDGDGFGDSSLQAPLLIQCQQTAGLINNQTDCDDQDSTISPAAPLGCFDIDQNCDGVIDNDNDGDGWSDVTCGGSDCNDANPNVYEGSGLVSECAVLDCDELFLQDPTLPNDVYWIDPDGNGAFEAFCAYDNSTQSGWTMVMRSVNTDIPYGSSLWTTTDLYDATNWNLTQTGYAKYEAFNRVPFTNIRTANPSDFTEGYTETFSVGYSSALDLFASTGFSLTLSTTVESYFFGLITNGYYSVYGCAQYRNYGFNQQDYLGTGFISAGSYCDWNGGARWGMRYNASHNGTGNHQGIGWGNYTTIGYAPQSISQVMWVQ